MDNSHLRRQIAAMRQSFFDEGILDGQFFQLEYLESRGNPDFVEEVFTLYFRESTPLLQTVEEELSVVSVPVDLVKTDRILHRVKGSSASIGAIKVRNEIDKTRKLLEEGNLESAKTAFQELRREHDKLKDKLWPYFQQLRQVGPVETASRPR